MIWNRFGQWVSEMRGRQDFTYILAIERPSVRLFPLLQAGSVVYTWCWCGGGWVVEWKCSGAWLGHAVNCVRRDLVKLIETCFHFIPGLTQWTTEGNVATKRRQVVRRDNSDGEWEVRCVMRCRLRGSSREISKEGVKPWLNGGFAALCNGHHGILQLCLSCLVQWGFSSCSSTTQGRQI